MADVSLQSLLDQARHAIDTGDTERAIGMAQHILQFIPTLIEGHRLLGEAYLNSDQPDQAQAAFQAVLEADPENIPAFYGLGLAHQRLAQQEAAIRAFEMALEIQPNLAELRTQLLRLYAETPGSAGQFRLSRSGLGRLYARGQMYSQAIDEFRAVLETEPDRNDVRVALAETLWRDGQEDEAGDWSRETIERQPRLHKPTLIAGYLELAAGEPEGEELWRRAAQQEPSLQVANTLFEVLPPITIPEPTLPAFDEQAWRAGQTAAMAPSPVDSDETSSEATTAVLVDHDAFGDRPAAAPHGATETPAASTPGAAPSTEAAGADLSDNDLLAQLLGFADDPDGAAGIEPVTHESTALYDTTDDALHGAVEPLPESFSFDDWSFEDEPAGATPATIQEPRGEIRPFSLHEPGLDRNSGAADPFSLQDPAVEETRPRTEPPTPRQPPEGIQGAQPFSLEELFDEPESARREAPARAFQTDAQVPPSFEDDSISLRDLGLTDQVGQPDTGPTPPPAGERPPDATPRSPADDFMTFSLHDFDAERDDPQPAVQQPTDTLPAPKGELPAWAHEDTGDQGEAESEIPQWLRDQFAQPEHADTGGAVRSSSQTVEQVREPQSELQPFSFADLGLDEADFVELRLDEPAGAATSAPDDADSSGLADLGLTDDELARFGEQPTPPVPEEPAPAALADLGLTDEELASFSTDAEGTAAMFPSGDGQPWDVTLDEDTGATETTLDEAPRVDGSGQEESADAIPVDPVHETETQPFDVAAVAAKGGTGQPDGDASPDPVLPPVPPELGRYYEKLETDPDNHTIRLALARLSEQKGDTERAIEQYRQLIRRSALIEPVVEDLQELASGDYERPVLRRIHRLLGDAYTRQNRLDEALDEYSWT